MHPWQITAWLNRERLTREQGAERLGISVTTLGMWRQTRETFSPRQVEGIIRVMGEVPPMPSEMPVLWCSPTPGQGRPGVLSASEFAARRDRLGFTPTEFAHFMGFSRSYLENIAKGRRRCSERVAMVLAAIERRRG
jgi:DNA-binding transcriptional regulator YiaG